MNKIWMIVLAIIAVAVIAYIIYIAMKKSKKTNVMPEIIFVTNCSEYDIQTQENVEETFFNLVLLREIIDNGDKDTQEILIKPVLESLSKVVQKIKPALEEEKEIIAKIHGTTFRVKKDGMGNICFGSPEYFMCLNPSKNELYPYINDMLVVYHLMRQRSLGMENRKYRDSNVELILNTILSNVVEGCNNGTFFLDYGTKYEDLILTKLFNSKLNTEILASLMMILLFYSNSVKVLENISMNKNGSFAVNNKTLIYLQQFHRSELTNMIPYKEMKHVLFNMCYAKYTIHGYSVLSDDAMKLDDRKQIIDKMLKTSTCKPFEKNDVASVSVPVVKTPTEEQKPPLKSILKEPSTTESYENFDGEEAPRKKICKKVTFI